MLIQQEVTNVQKDMAQLRRNYLSIWGTPCKDLIINWKTRLSCLGCFVFNGALKSAWSPVGELSRTFQVPCAVQPINTRRKIQVNKSKKRLRKSELAKSPSQRATFKYQLLTPTTKSGRFRRNSLSVKRNREEMVYQSPPLGKKWPQHTCECQDKS